MGIHGWDLLDPHPRTLNGIVRKAEWNGGITGDGDWSLFIEPAAGFEDLLTNPRKGRRNLSGRVECEVEPSIDPADDGDLHSPTEDHYFSPLVGKVATVWGPWVADCSHSWNDDSCLFGCCDVGKTEIHPIFSLQVELEPPPGNPSATVIEVFVFSDDSDAVKPPNAGENITAQFNIPFPHPPSHATGPKFHLSSVTNQAASAQFSSVDVNGQIMLQGTVQSGRPSDGKGFYHAVIKLGFHSSSVRESFAGRGDLSQGLRSLHPLFDDPITTVRSVMESLD